MMTNDKYRFQTRFAQDFSFIKMHVMFFFDMIIMFFLCALFLYSMLYKYIN